MQYITGCDGTPLASFEFLVEQPKAIVICVHGMADHQRRYHRLARFLQDKQYAVITYDHRGHGESRLAGEELGYLGIDGFQKMVEDLHIIVKKYRSQFPQTKLIIFGHSMGSFVTQRYLQLYDEADGAIIMGSSYKTFGTRFGKWLAKLMLLFNRGKKPGYFFDRLIFGGYNKQFKPNQTTADWLNRDLSQVNDYLSDEYCGFVLSNQFYYDFLSGLLEVQKTRHISEIRKDLPLLFLSGDRDPVGRNGKQIRKLAGVYNRFSQLVECKLYPDARHELIVEINHQEVYEDMYQWLEKYK